MADKQSREFIETKVSNGVNESSVKVNSEGITLSALKIDIDVDVSEALKGLKAVQREAKKATHELNAMSASGFSIRADGSITMHKESYSANTFFTVNVLREFTTEQLARELSRRGGVSSVEIGSSDIQSTVITIEWREVTE